VLPVRTPCHWGKLWDQRWFRLAVPAALAARRDLYLAWDDQAEATLHLEYGPHHGFDPAHKFAPLPGGHRVLWIESVCCQTAIWHPAMTGLHPHGSHLRGASLVERDTAVWDFYHDLLALNDLAQEELKALSPQGAHYLGFQHRPDLVSASPLLRRLLRVLAEALDLYECQKLPAAARRLRRAYAELRAAPNSLRAVLTGHSHLDLVWLWPEQVGVFKASHTFATVLSLMERYPEFRFGYSQPASYDAVARRDPALFKRVKNRLRDGRWEATGVADVESDTLLACGEALARSFLIGQERFTALRGSPARVLWLPDVFGYSACVPQLLRECGADYFYTTKLSWNSITRFPCSSFVWRGHDGSEVVAHLTQEGGYIQEATPGQLRAGERFHRQADVHPEFLAPTGYGDGGGGPTEEICERARRYADLSGLPRAQWGGIEDFFDRLSRRRRDLPVYQGELYLEMHRGTYTTHGGLKADYRAAERALQIQEAARCARHLGPVPLDLWRRVVFAQFHDYIPGSSIHEVYKQGRAELRDVAAHALTDVEHTLSVSGHAEAFFNPLPRPRPLVLPPSDDGRPSIATLPPLSGTAFDAPVPTKTVAPVTVSIRHLANGRLRAEFDDQGRVVALVTDGVATPLRSPLGELVLYPDHPAIFEAWDIDRHTLGLGRPVRTPARAAIEGDNRSSATLAFTRALGEAGNVRLVYLLEADSAVLRLTVEIDWRARQSLLKLHFPTAFTGRQVRYGAPFGSVTRSQWPGPTADEAKWEVPASRWAVVSDDNEHEGFAVITEAKYGFSCRDGDLALSLLRSAAITGEGYDSQTRGKNSHPPSLRREHARVPFSDLGRQRIELAFGRAHAAQARDEQPAALADLLFTPLLAYRGPACHAGLLDIEGGDTLHPVWAKPEDNDAWVLRLNETSGRHGRARLRLAPGWTAIRVNLLGKPLSTRPARALAYGPYALLSLRILRMRA